MQQSRKITKLEKTALHAESEKSTATGDEANNTNSENETTGQSNSKLNWRQRIDTERLILGLVVVASFTLLVFLFYEGAVRSFPGSSDGASGVLEGQSIAQGHWALSNWSLSLDSFWTVDALMYALFAVLVGIKGYLLHLVPAFLAALCVGVGCLISVDGRRRVGTYGALGVVLLLLALPSQNFQFFFFQGDWHTGTTLWILVSFWLVRRYKWGWGMVGSAVVLGFAIDGDFLAIALGVVPLALAGLVGMARTKSIRMGIVPLATSLLSCLIALILRLLALAQGTFAIVKVSKGSASHQKLIDLENIPSDMLHLFGTGGTFAGTSPLWIQAAHIGGVLIFTAGIVVSVISIIKGIFKKKELSRLRHDISITWRMNDMLVLGVFGSFAVFIGLGDSNGSDYLRYLTPAVIFGSILAARYVGTYLEKMHRFHIRAIATTLGCIMLLSYSAGFVSSLDRTPKTPNAVELGQFLESHNLHLGLGSYWSSSITTILTNEDVTIRPVITGLKGTFVPDIHEADSSWFKNQNFQFLVYSTTLRDSVTPTVAQLTFGIPNHTYAIGNFRIETWRYPISLDLTTGPNN